MPDAPEEAIIAAAVIVHEGKVLLIKRSMPEGDLIWQFPAGKIETGETSEMAAERETCEETGLIVRAHSRLGERVHPQTKRTMIYLACDVESGIAYPISKREVAEVAWVAGENLDHYVPHGFFAPVQKYLDGLLS